MATTMSTKTEKTPPSMAARATTLSPAPTTAPSIRMPYNHQAEVGTSEGSGRICSGPSSCPYSPKCVEEEFCELRLLGILGSSLPASNAQATPKIAHLSDTSAPIRQYATLVTDKGTL